MAYPASHSLAMIFIHQLKRSNEPSKSHNEFEAQTNWPEKFGQQQDSSQKSPLRKLPKKWKISGYQENSILIFHLFQVCHNHFSQENPSRYQFKPDNSMIFNNYKNTTSKIVVVNLVFDLTIYIPHPGPRPWPLQSLNK